MAREDLRIDPIARDDRTATGALTLGFIPLVDCAPLVVAHEKGFAKQEGLTLTLVRETSWANIRDRVALGHFDAAHMLGPMPIASSLGIGRPAVAMVAPLSLGLGGNAITLSPAFFAAMIEPLSAARDAVLRFEPAATADALAAVLVARRLAGHETPTLAVVHPFSAHNYELRYWLASAGIDPDRDVRLTVLPPSMMVESIKEGLIDGFCAGEPWNSLAVEAGAGVIVATKSALWRQAPEKVLGLRSDFVERHADETAALVRVLYRSAEWAEQAEHQAELADLMADPAYLGTDPDFTLRALRGSIVRLKGYPAEPVPDFQLFHGHAANFPWTSHALWFYAQMVRWGHVDHTADHAASAQAVYRPDLYRSALAATAADLPGADAKVEGALQQVTPVPSRFGTLTLGPDGFFDGRLFDPDKLDQYIADFAANPPTSAE